MTRCEICGGVGVVEVADIYRRLPDGTPIVAWQLATSITCPGCQEDESA